MTLDARTAHLARPTGAPRGAVLVLGGSEGGHHPKDADALAKEGFVALSYAYFGAPGTPRGLVRIAVEDLRRGVDLLREVAPEAAVGLLGGSRGGEAALLLATTDPRVRAVVSVVGSGVLTPAIDYERGHLRDVLRGEAPAWTVDGVALPALPHVRGERLAAAIGTGEHVRLRDTYVGLAEVDLEEVSIAVERSDAAILAISAAEDLMWDSPALSEVSFERLRRHRHHRRHRHVTLDSGHLIAGPPRPAGPTLVPGPGVRFESGGDPHRNAAAQRQAWTLTTDWLGTELAVDPG